jgi:hypothetical protein
MTLMILSAMAIAFVCILVGLWLDNRDEVARRRDFQWW